MGWGGAYPLLTGEMSWGAKGPIPNRSRVITFALDAQTKLPRPDPVPVRTLQKVELPSSAETIAIGKQSYYRTCVACHGGNAISGGIAPDLRYSPTLADEATWSMVVADGALAERGMIGFKKNFSAQQIAAIRAYVVAEAHKAAR